MSRIYSKEDILAKAKEVADQLSSAEQVRFYKQAEAKISGNPKVEHLVEEIKMYQKESVNLQHFQKHEAFRQNEAKIDRLQAELDSIPVVQEFKQSQEDVNDFLQLIVKLMSQRVADAAERHPGERPQE